jgi:bifunctional non-homologous end joining protein LigD
MISHPDKVLFPDAGITKGDLAAYYEDVASVMLPHLRGRPVTMERYPAGISAQGFWQKDVSRGFPAWLTRVNVPKKGGGIVHYPVANDRRALQWMSNQNTITHHVWTSRAPRLDYPDVCVFDLDPSSEDPAGVRTAALALRDLLDELGLTPLVKTSGSKGFHVIVALGGRTPVHDVVRFADAVARLLVSRAPEQLTVEFSKADRSGRLYVDTGRNTQGATFAAVYTVRARPGAPVSAPCTWDEIEAARVHPRSFTVKNLKARLDDIGDIWEGLRRHGQSLARPTAKLRRLMSMDAEVEVHSSGRRPK